MTKKAKSRLRGAAILVVVLGGIGLYIWKRSQVRREPSLDAVLQGMGFTILNPPCNLTPPGAMITLISRDPLVPGLICPLETSLGTGAQERLKKSDTISVSAAAKLSETFSLAGDWGDLLSSSAKFKDVKDVRLSLTNVTVLELPDDVVFELLSQRTGPCTEAIAARRQTGVQVSIVKVALYADATITIEYASEASSSTKATLTRELAVSMGADLMVGGDNTIVGTGLIWGIRDDMELAKAGLGLPSSGGSERPRLLAAGLRLDTEELLQSLPSLAEQQVTPLKQPTSNSCWAAVWTMMKSWKEGRTLTIDEAVTSIGEPWLGYYKNDTRLPGGAESNFADAAGLKTMWPANHTVKGWIEFLRKYGPLWVFVADGISSHALLVVGVRGEESFEGAYLSVIDPLTGRRTERLAADFAKKFEQEASRIVTLLRDRESPLRLQVLHWPQR